MKMAKVKITAVLGFDELMNSLWRSHADCPLDGDKARFNWIKGGLDSSKVYFMKGFIKSIVLSFTIYCFNM